MSGLIAIPSPLHFTWNETSSHSTLILLENHSAF